MKRKTFSYNFTSGDVETLLFTLSILPGLNVGVSEAQTEINTVNCISAAEKLRKSDSSITANEFRVMCASISAASMILCGYIPVEDEILHKCQRYALTINKLNQHLSPLLDAYLT